MCGEEYPEQIYLQREEVDGLLHDEQTWCADRVNRHDVEYVRADILESMDRIHTARREALADEIERLKACIAEHDTHFSRIADAVDGDARDVPDGYEKTIDGMVQYRVDSLQAEIKQLHGDINQQCDDLHCKDIEIDRLRIQLTQYEPGETLTALLDKARRERDAALEEVEKQRGRASNAIAKYVKLASMTECPQCGYKPPGE